MRLRVFAFALVSALLPGAGFAATYDIDASHSTVGFRIRHFVSRVNGSFTKVSGAIEYDAKRPAAAKVTATIETASITTANERRDGHLKSADFFDVEKYPSMTFVSKKVTAAGKNRLKVLGDLTLHGICKPVVLDVTYSGQATDPWGGKRAGFSASTRINRKDYGVVWNKVLDQGGTMLGDDVDITLDIEAVEKK